MTIVYCPIAHWIWHPNGWLFNLGILDFAGGLVVHLSSGTSALAFSILMRRREGYKTLWDYFLGLICPKKSKKKTVFEPHSIPLVFLGTGILWFGWFLFILIKKVWI
jgi:Amt family ammonium transporter